MGSAAVTETTGRRLLSEASPSPEQRKASFEFLTFSEFANLMASLSVPTTAALLTVDAPPAGRAHAAAFPLLLAGADGEASSPAWGTRLGPPCAGRSRPGTHLPGS